MASSRIPLRVQPRARRTGIEVRTGAAGPEAIVRVAAAPERGPANAAVEAAIASVLGLPTGTVRVAVGRSSRRKLVDVPLAAADVWRRLATAPRSPPTG